MSSNFEELKEQSYLKEARFECVKDFLRFGKPALVMMIDLGCHECGDGRTDAEFEAKYKVSKKEVRWMLLRMDLWEETNPTKLNEVYDELVEVLS